MNRKDGLIAQCSVACHQHSKNILIGGGLGLWDFPPLSVSYFHFLQQFVVLRTITFSCLSSSLNHIFFNALCITMMRRKPKLQQAWASDLLKLKEQNHKIDAEAFFFLNFISGGKQSFAIFDYPSYSLKHIILEHKWGDRCFFSNGSGFQVFSQNF